MDIEETNYKLKPYPEKIRSFKAGAKKRNMQTKSKKKDQHWNCTRARTYLQVFVFIQVNKKNYSCIEGVHDHSGQRPRPKQAASKISHTNRVGT